MNNITIDLDRFCETYLNRLNQYSKRDDRLIDKMEKAEDAGDTERAKKLDRQSDMLEAKMDGMEEVLYMLGFVVQWQKDHFVIVHR